MLIGTIWSIASQSSCETTTSQTWRIRSLVRALLSAAVVATFGAFWSASGAESPHRDGNAPAAATVRAWGDWVARGEEAQRRGDYSDASRHYAQAGAIARHLDNPRDRRCLTLDAQARSTGAQAGRQFLNTWGRSPLNVDRAARVATLTYGASRDRAIGQSAPCQQPLAKTIAE